MPPTQYIYVGDPNYQEPEHWGKQGSNIYYNTGNVGIGQAVPQNKLVVDGSVSIGESPYSESPAPTGGLIVKGNVGIGTTVLTADTKLDVRGNTRVIGDLFVSGQVSGSGLTQWNNQGNDIYFMSNVGIGTTTPASKLSVVGNTVITGNLTVNGTVSSSGTAFSQWTNNANGIHYSAANVGIGIALPTSKLHIVGNTRIEGDLTVNGTQTIINTNVGTTERLVITNDGTGPALEVNQTGAQPVCDFQDDGTSALKIINGGNVGIGTATPNYKLQVQGDIYASGNVFRQFVGCSVRGSQSITSGTITTLVYSTVDVNSGGYSSSTGIFTCPVAGYYLITATVLNQTSGANRLRLFRDTTQISPDGYSLANEYASVSVSAITYCSANNTLLSKALYAQGAYSSMAIYLIG